MPTRYFLNKLDERKKSGQLQGPDQGVWYLHGDFLANFAANIFLDGEADLAVVHSVPSVYQRAIQFSQALSDPENSLHKAVRRQWRGLLAAVALSDWLGLTLEMRAFRVPPEEKNASSAVGRMDIGDLHFRAILREQMPKPATDWDHWWMIYGGNVLLGATSPWTAVYTPATRKQCAAIPWMEEGILQDPVEFFLSRRAEHGADYGGAELRMLHAWLSALLREQSNWGWPRHLQPHENVVAARLREWQAELAEYAEADFEMALAPALISGAPYDKLLRRPDRTPESADELKLETADADVLVFTDDLDPGVRVHRGVFGSRIDVGALDAEGTRFTTTDGYTINRKYIRADKLFLPPKLFRLPLSAKAKRAGDIALPLTPAFFGYLGYRALDPNENPSALSVRRSGDEIQVTLGLPLKNNTLLEVKKTYALQDVLSMETPPVLALWPDFYDRQWGEFDNFAACNFTCAHDESLRVSPLFIDGKTAAEEAFEGADQHPSRIWQLDRPPIGFALQWGPATQRQKPVPVGLVLRSQLTPSRLESGRSAGKWEVAIDFGTSSTMVMLNEGGRRVPLEFQGRTVFLTENTEENESRRRDIANNLYPDQSVIPPFNTLVYEGLASFLGNHVGRVYTPRYIRAAVSTQEPVANLKWGRHGEGRDPMGAYLRALVRYVVAEARSAGADTLEFRWSYPLSLPEELRSPMESFWRTIADKYRREELEVYVADSPLSESEAVCRCLAGLGSSRPLLPIHIEALSVVVDVGGGSTDIAFWSEKTLLSQVSLKLAGNDVFDPEYIGRREMAEVWRICAKELPSESALDLALRNPSLYLNAILTEAAAGNPRLHPVPHHIHDRHQDEDPWVRFRSMIYLIFTGLAYYIGSHARTVPFDKSQVRVYFGGRGSQLLTWLDNRPAKLQDMLEQAFREGAQHADGKILSLYEKHPSLQVYFAGAAIDSYQSYPALKTEVAWGLLSGLQDLASRDPGTKPLGECQWSHKNGQKLDWDYPLDKKILGGLVAPRNFGSTEIGNFLTSFVHNPKYKSLLDFELFKSLQLDGNSVENTIRDAAGNGDYIVQPIFAYELKALMANYAHAVAAARSGGSTKARSAAAGHGGQPEG